MLIQLNIQNFAIVEQLEIDFQKGMSAITGETGAGKSIAIDALGLCLGNRVEGNIVRKGASKADLSARFLLEQNIDAQAWLKAHDLEDESSKECLLRRIIGEEGRSKGFINGTPVPVSLLRELGELLIQIHGQHAHQTLLKNDNQRNLLDAYLDNTDLIKSMRAAYKLWSDSCRALSQNQTLAAERLARAELLSYQLEELEEFAPVAGEYEANDEEYKRLSNCGDLLLTSQNVINILQDDEQMNISNLITKAKQDLTSISRYDKKLESVLAMLEEADIQINEACDELRHHAQAFEMDPQRLYELEKRLSKQLQLARKHQIKPENLPDYYEQIKAEAIQFKSQQEDQAELVAKIDEQFKAALTLAAKVNKARRKASKELSEKITTSMHALAMPHGQFDILIAHEPEYLSAHGADKIEFVVTTNPGQPLAGLAKVASGGELSRMSLAIQVITAQKMSMPALIFDEVDVGISGPTAAIVGQLLRQLGETTQVLCVTHLPQVAAAAHQHFYVNKIVDMDKNQEMVTTTKMHILDYKGRLNELARLLGGTQITENTLANAKELFESF